MDHPPEEQKTFEICNPGHGRCGAMRIKEFAIWKYGPLAGAGKMELGDLNLFFGPNEQGKTLMIDALVKML